MSNQRFVNSHRGIRIGIITTTSDGRQLGTLFSGSMVAVYNPGTNVTSNLKTGQMEVGGNFIEADMLSYYYSNHSEL